MRDSVDRQTTSDIRDWMSGMAGEEAVAPAPPPAKARARQNRGPSGRRRIIRALVALDAAIVLVAGLLLASQMAGARPVPSPTATPTLLAALPTPSPTPSPTPTPTPTPPPTGPTPRVTGTVIDTGPTAEPSPQRPTPPDKLTGYVWPLADANGFQVTLPYGPSPWGEALVDGQLFHDGVDMATQCGDYVRAAHAGTVLVASRDYVTFMGWQGDVSRFVAKFSSPAWKASLPIVIVIDDGDGYRSIYAHEYKVSVKAGQKVKAGQIIGYEGATGNASGCHVHFGLYSPLETATFDNLPKFMAAPTYLPAQMTARIDPLLVLPYRNDVAEMRTLRPWDAAIWDAAHPSP
jgi:murein DD-endopeptidase MepM/ murein hydrolase activator NlpD